MEDFPYYKTLIEHMSTSLVVLDQQFSVVFMNAAAERDLECSLTRAKHQIFTTVFYSPQDFNEHLYKAIEKQRVLVFREAVFIVHNNERRFDIIITPFEEDQLHPTILLELRHLDRILKISKEEQFSDHHKVSRELIRGIAHEVKNPLGGIRGASQLLERLLPADQKEYTQLIVQEVDRLSSLVNSMLGPHTPLIRELVNIHEITEHCIKLVEIEHTHIHIERQYDLSLPEIEVDKDRCIQALLNICINGAQAFSRGERPFQDCRMIFTTRIARQITLHQKLYRHAIEILIEDNGPGIPNHLKDSLFYPFVTSRPNGTGIGLSIAQHIVQEHGGIVEYTSQSGSTIFHCFFPIHST